MAKMLAFDFGASGGRAILSEITDEKIKISEIHRFSNDPVKFSKHLHWDILRLVYEVKQGLIKCKNIGNSDIESFGIDTWGVDFGLLDKEGELIGNPVHYRDIRTDEMFDKCFSVISRDELYKRTGIFFAQFNSIYQLLSLKCSNSWEIKQSDFLLLMPDLIGYVLSQVKKFRNTQMLQKHNFIVMQKITGILS